MFVYPKDGTKSSAWKTDASHRKPAGEKPATWDATKPKKRDRDAAEVKAKTVKSRKVEWAADPAAVLEKSLIKLAPNAKADAFKAGTGAAADGLALLSQPQNLDGILAKAGKCVFTNMGLPGNVTAAVIANNTTDKLCFAEVTLPKADWDSLPFSGNIPLSACSIGVAEGPNISGKILTAPGQNINIIFPNGTNWQPKSKSLPK